jgi:hypothetical protein
MGTGSGDIKMEKSGNWSGLMWDHCRAILSNPTNSDQSDQFPFLFSVKLFID